MPEPPIYSSQNHSSQNLPNELPNENPFAPPTAGVNYDSVAGRVQLNSTYWLALFLMASGSFTLAFIGFPFGWPAIFATITAAIRVPLLQRKHSFEVASSGVLQPPLLKPASLLLTSLALMITFSFVSLIAFAAICIPGSIMFGLGSSTYNSVLIASSLAGLLAFCTMFALSLRLRF